jgi:Family of unknown function (DUF5317)
MFILYAIPLGIVIGYLLGGRLDRLAALRIRWAPLALIGLAVQIAIFSDPIGPLVGDAAPAIYVASTAAVLIAVLRNLDIPGIAIIAVGASCNLAAIVANGGYMPADPLALGSIGGPGADQSNSILVAEPALRPLTDLFALPAWMPFANVFSIGDVLIAVGLFVLVHGICHSSRSAVSATTARDAPTPQ